MDSDALSVTGGVGIGIGYEKPLSFVVTGDIFAKGVNILDKLTELTEKIKELENYNISVVLEKHLPEEVVKMVLEYR